MKRRVQHAIAEALSRDVSNFRFNEKKSATIDGGLDGCYGESSFNEKKSATRYNGFA